MHNMGQEKFSYETFKTAYDSDTRLSSIVSDFNEEEIILKDDELVDEPSGSDTDIDTGSEVNSMSQLAQQATDLGDM